MHIKFWGVHGSIPRPGPATLKFGGNTPCVEVRCEDTLIILDAGTGIRELGEDLLRRPSAASGAKAPITGHIFISHLHWDHMQGFAFFEPAFVKGNRFDVYGVGPIGGHLRATLDRQLAEPNFPLTLDDLLASFTFHDLLPAQSFQIGDVTVRVEELNHPGGSFGFRFDFDGKSLVYASDTEQVACVEDSVVDLARGADVLIFDSMFAPDQYHGLWDGVPRVSWGHSTWECAVDVALAAGVHRLVLFHHGNEDKIVADIERLACEKFPLTTAAYEGLEIEL